MKSIFQTSGFVILTLFIVTCATQAATTIAHLEPVPSKESVAANFTSEKLETGKILYEANCAKCHKLKEPGNKTPEEWNNTLKKMLPKTKLTYDEGGLVRAYLVKNSKE